MPHPGSTPIQIAVLHHGIDIQPADLSQHLGWFAQLMAPADITLQTIAGREHHGFTRWQRVAQAADQCRQALGVDRQPFAHRHWRTMMIDPKDRNLRANYQRP